MGGLSKKAYQIKVAGEHQKLPLLVLDSGNLLFKRLTIPPGESQETITAAGIIDSYGKMGYDAVAVGPLDLAAGTDFLKNRNNSHFAWISANIVNADNSPVFNSFIIKKTGRSRTGIIGLTHRAASLPPNLHIVDWQTILPELLQKLSKECDHIILLSNLPEKENIDIAKSHPDIHLIISADPQFGNLNPVLNNNTLITQTANQGKYLGILTIERGSSGRWEFDLVKELGVLNNKVDAIDRQIKKMESQKNSFPGTDLRLEQAINDRQNIVRQTESLNQKAREDSIRKVKPSTFTSNFIAINSSLPDSADIEKIISGMKQKNRDFNRPSQHSDMESNRIDSKKTTQLTRIFTGYEQCETCHRVQTDFWKSTQHARSFATLQKRGQEHNLECLPCHVTHSADLFGKDSFAMKELLNLPSSMQAVGCESCHGAGRAHADDPENIRPIRYVNKHTCLNCHTNERDSGFEYEKKRGLIQCPAG